MAIVINSTTGEIDLDQTTPNTYIITYTVQGVSSTQEVTVNAVDNAAFSYSASSYAPTDPDPTPTITGLTGGTFSAGSGLVFVDSGTNTGSSTGEIDLSASTVASYTITYDTTSSGSSVCPNTSTQTVEIAVAGIANNYSFSFDGTNDYIDCNTSLNGMTSITYSAWIKPQAPSGVYGYILTAGNYSNTDRMLSIAINKSNRKIFVFGGQGSGGIKESNFTVTYGTWYHVAIVYTNNQDVDFYVNGNAEGSIQFSDTSSIASGSPTRIGVYSGTLGNYFSGSIDEVGIWNTELTSTQIQSIYNATGTNLTKDLSEISGLVYWNRMGD